MQRLSSEQRFIYVSGIVEGLAFARYQRDGKDATGMDCLYRWFYGSGEAAAKVDAAFTQFPDYTPGAVVAVLANRECGQ